jgi:hypothetical protein
MKYVRTDEIECSETECCAPNGDFCKFLGISKPMMQAKCSCFKKTLESGDGERIGWSKRCKQCLEMFVAIKSPDKIDGHWNKNWFIPPEDNPGITSIKDRKVYNLDVEDTLGRGVDNIPEHNRQNPPVYRKHMESVGLTVRYISGRVYVFNKENGKVWEYDEIEWSYGASAQLMVNHTPIHVGVVQRDVLDSILEGK